MSDTKNSVVLIQRMIDEANKDIESRDRRIENLKREREVLCTKVLTLQEAIKTISTTVSPSV